MFFLTNYVCSCFQAFFSDLFSGLKYGWNCGFQRGCGFTFVKTRMTIIHWRWDTRPPIPTKFLCIQRRTPLTHGQRRNKGVHGFNGSYTSCFHGSCGFNMGNPNQPLGRSQVGWIGRCSNDLTHTRIPCSNGVLKTSTCTSKCLASGILHLIIRLSVPSTRIFWSSKPTESWHRPQFWWWTPQYSDV